MTEPGTPLPRITETVLKHKKSLQQIEYDRKAWKAKQKVKTKEGTRIKFKAPEKFVKEYRCAARAHVAMVRAGKREVVMDTNEKLLLVIRVRKHGETGAAKKILNNLRVSQLHNAAFWPNTPKIAKWLNLVQKFVVWGHPSVQTVRELITKRGYARVNGARVALTDNAIIEKALAAQNVVCTEDLVHEIYSVGPAFKEVSDFLWSFKLNPSFGTYIQGVTEKEEVGNHGHKVDDLVKKMN